jgi:hypothetical protein
MISPNCVPGIPNYVKKGIHETTDFHKNIWSERPFLICFSFIYSFKTYPTHFFSTINYESRNTPTKSYSKFNAKTKAYVN